MPKNIRKKCLMLSNEGKDGNLQSIFSSIEIMWTLYNKIMNWESIRSKKEDRDFFILSKGQATLGLYVILQEKGFFSWNELKEFCKYDSRFSMQADRTKFNGGIEISAGSLGHGFPMAVGVALANKIKNITSRIYVLVGDGEMNEGTMWEACLLANHKKLDNLCLIIDNNRSIGKMIQIESFEEKLNSFGFKTFQVNGHDDASLECVLKEPSNGAPMAIIANTIRGYGSETLMKDNSWFHRAPNDDELESLLKEVEDFA